jgi:hypothetical protein
VQFPGSDKAAYAAGDLDFFTKGQLTNVWCHGAPGIGLSRLRAYEILGSPSHWHEATLALSQTTAPFPHHLGTFTLCHGRGGNAELLLEACRVLGDPQYLSAAVTVAQEAIATRESIGKYLPGLDVPHEDNSLFLGTAGVGYFYLRLLDPFTTPSLLAPRLEAAPAPVAGPALPHLTLSTAALGRAIIQKVFTRTLHVLAEVAPQRLAGYFGRLPNRNWPGVKGDWEAFVGEQIDQLPHPGKARLADVFGLEKQAADLDDAVRSDTLLQFKAVRKADAYARRGGTDSSRVSLVLDYDVRVVETRWNWGGDNPADWSENLHAGAEQFFVLLQPTVRGVQAVPIALFTRVLLEIFATPQTVGTAVEEVVQQLQWEAPAASPAGTSALVEEQIDQLRGRSFLLEPGKHPLNGHLASPADLFVDAALAPA